MISELVEKAIIGDESAITELYNQTYQTSYSIAVSIIKDENEAFDILQESYISAFKNLEKLQDKSKFNSWLNHIVSNKCKDYFRKKKPDFLADNTYSSDEGEIEVELEDKNLTFSPEDNMDYSETKRIIAEMLNNLPDDQRMVILMYYMQDMSIKEIAEILDVSENTVKSRMNYGKKKLKTQVEDLEKKGTKLYGISGIMLLPFIKWMLSQSDSSKKIPPIGNILKNILGETATEVGNTVVTSTAVQSSAVKMAVKKSINNLGARLQQKIVIAFATVVLITGTGTTAVVLKNKTQSAKSNNVVTSYSTVKVTTNAKKTSIKFSETSISTTLSTSLSSTITAVTTKPTTGTEITKTISSSAETATTKTVALTIKQKTIKTTKKTTVAKKEFLSDDYDLYENSDGTFTFKNCTADGTVKIPSSYDGTSVTEIGSNAFRNSGATKIYIPSSITSISNSAFDGLWGVTLYCKSGSYAETYAIKNKYDYKIY